MTRPPLARISHHLTAKARDRCATTSLRSIVVLSGPSSTPPRANHRPPRIDSPLTHFRSPRGEKCGLVLWFLLALTPAFGADSAASAYENGIRHFVAENYSKAQQSFEQAVRAEPENADYHVWLGRTYGRRAERNSGLKIFSSYGLARKTRGSFEQAVELEPKNLHALESLFSYYLEAPGIVGGGASKARKIAKQIEGVDEARGTRAWASYYESQRQFDDAEAAIEKARRLEPNDIGHLLSQASYLARRGWSENADELFEVALKNHPDNPEVWFARAKALIRAERESKYDEARELLKRYLATPLVEPDAEPYSNVRKLLKEI
jgi:tetratricopeptide (TPR) repeat protein